VAGFVGRTNFLDGTARSDAIAFPGFALPSAGLADLPAPGEKASFSVRPWQIATHDAPPAPGDGCWRIEGRVVERAYLGEQWEYVVQPLNSALRLRVSTPPLPRREVGQAVWLEIDPRVVARIPPP
jgi:iron(III) transport system ATP-binding protein